MTQPLFTARHYEWLVRWLINVNSEIGGDWYIGDWYEICHSLSKHLKADNPNFNEEKFAKAIDRG